MIAQKQKTQAVVFLLLGFSIFSPSPAQDWYQVLEKTDGSITLEVRVPAPRLDSTATANGLITTLRAGDWPLSSGAHRPRLPFYDLLLALPGEHAHLTLLSAGTSVTLAIELAKEPPDSSSEINSDLATWTPAPGEGAVWPPVQPVVLKHLGIKRGEHLWNVTIAPFQYDAQTRLLTYPASLRLRIDAAVDRKVGGAVPLRIVDNAALWPQQPMSLKKPAAITHDPPASSPAGPFCKLYIDQDGLYRIDGGDLRALGQNLLAVDIKKLRLTYMGEPVPIYVHGWQDGQFDEQDYIEFWAQSRRQTYQTRSADLYQDPFGKTAVYWLSWSEERGTWMTLEPAGMINPQATNIQRPFSFYETVHVERDDFFERLRSLSSPDSLRDHWYYGTYLGAGRKFDFPFELDYPDARSSLPVKVRAMLCGVTTVNTDPHRVTLFLNGRYLLKGMGFRQEMMDLRSSDEIFFSASELFHRDNALTLVNDYDAEKSDYVVLNWFEVTYPRLYRARDNYIKFSIPPDSPPGRFQFRIDGFESEEIEIYKLGASKLTGGLTQRVKDFEGFESIQIGFEDLVQSRDAQYVAVAQSAKRKPVRMEILPQWPVLSADTPVDYLVITPKKFLTTRSLEDLLALRQSQGFRAGKIAISDIYDLFGYGHSSSYALKAFLRWAYDHWSVRHVLLLGDGCYVRTPVQGDTLDLIPVHFRQTVNFGATVCDYWYGLLDGEDDLADVHIGRLPVRDEVQLKTIVDKIIGYETQVEPGIWRNRLLFLGGEGLPFRSKGLQLAHEAPVAYSTSMLFTTRDENLSVDPFYGGTEELLDYFDQGCTVVNFHGHGGGAIWSDNGLFRLEDVDLMNNRNKYPLVLSMTCYTGAFDDLTMRNLSEVMLFAENRGTIFFLGTSGAGWMDNDALLQKEIMDCLYRNPGQTIGEIIDAGKIRYFGRYHSDIAFSEINQYSFLGDPASRLKVPFEGVQVSLEPPLLQKGDTLRIHARMPFSRGTSVCEVADSSLVVHSQQSSAVSGNEARFSVVLSNAFRSRTGSVRVYAVNELGSEHIHGAAHFSLDAVLFDSTAVHLTELDSVIYDVYLQSRSPLQRVWCLAQGDTLAMRTAGPGWYRTEKGQPARDVIRYSFQAQTMAGQIVNSNTFTYNWSGQLQLEADGQAWRWREGADLILQVPIQNWGESSGQAVVNLEVRDAVNEWQWVAADTVAMQPVSISWANFSFSAAPGRYRTRVGVRPLQMNAATVNYAQMVVDVTSFQVPVGGGFQLGAVRVDSLVFDSHCTLVSPIAASQRRAVVSVQPSYPAIIHDQPGLFAAEEIPAYTVLITTDGLGGNTLQLVIRSPLFMAPNDSAGKRFQFYRYETKTRKWLRLPTQSEPGALMTGVWENGQYGVFWADDLQPPQVEVIIDGMPATSELYTSAQPQVSILIHDENGVDVTPSSLRILLDGGQAAETFALPDSVVDGNHIHLEGLLQLTTGPHQLEVWASDCNGNVLTPLKVDLTVAEKFELKMLGNYPNPFKRQTVFAYTLTSPAAKIVLKIYTSAGQLIRNMDGYQQEDTHPQGAGYHEWIWDGADEDGHQVANGVYFFKLSAESGGKKHEITGKLARLE